MILKNLIFRNYLALSAIYVKWIFNFFRISSVSNIRKRKFIIKQAFKYDLDTIVETGTYFGHSTIYFSKKFTKVFTIEISRNLYDFVARKFIKHENINSYLGDSSFVIDEIIKKINGPAVFFLDGHASGGVTECGDKPSPVREELKILSLFPYLQKSILFIDDAAGFDGKNSYPSFQEVARWCLENKLKEPKVELDMLVIFPAP
jgi:hypothetical protein